MGVGRFEGTNRFLAVIAFAAGIGLSMLLCFILALVLFQLFWSAGLYSGFGITLGISVILAIVAGVFPVSGSG